MTPDPLGGAVVGARGERVGCLSDVGAAVGAALEKAGVVVGDTLPPSSQSTIDPAVNSGDRSGELPCVLMVDVRVRGGGSRDSSDAHCYHGCLPFIRERKHTCPDAPVTDV